MDWNTTYSFGPDGPWQGVIVGVNVPEIIIELQTVTLLPGGNDLMAFILTPGACSGNYSDPSLKCGIGGTIETPSDFISENGLGTLGGEGDMSGYGFDYSGNTSRATYSIGQQQWNATIAAMGDPLKTIVRYPSGVQIGPETGYFFIGQSPGGIEDSDLCPDTSCDPLGYLYQNNLIESRAYGLHFGSVSLDYPGSLVLGGYDNGRAIGPLIDASALQLLDVTISVETGASPFPFTSRSGLLTTTANGADTQPINMVVDPTDPYIFLPQQTVDAITSELPVYYNNQSGYYLWNTSDPLYSQVVTSASYLGFVFPSTTGSAPNTTIKVPFMLLNLTLETTISGLQTDVPYFPILSETLSDFTSAYDLGRSFLQAAFYGSNFNQNTTWLAQAPGPGQGGRGLGYDVMDISDNATTLDLQTGDNLFNDSWSGIWSPLPIASVTQNGTAQNGTASSSNASRTSSSGLSGGAIAGIVVGAVVLVLLLAVVAFLLFRRKRKSRKDGSNALGESEKVDQGRSELHGSGMDHELPQSGLERAEMPGQSDVKEMPAHSDAKELPSQPDPQELP